MRAILLKGEGDPDMLFVGEAEVPLPGPDQLLVRVRACALNRADLLQRRGSHPPPPGESSILGLEIAGDVVAMGSNVKTFTSGEKVMGLVGGGAYAEYCLLDQGMAIRLPVTLSYSQAAAIPEAFLTAQEALFSLGNLQPGESVLIHAGGSGVGSAAIQLARQVQANIFTTTSDYTKFEKIKAFGANEIIHYKDQDFAAEVLRLTQQTGVNVIVDFVGADYFAKHLSLLQINGRMSIVGTMRGSKTEFDLRVLMQKRLQIKGLMMRRRSLAEKRQVTQQFIQRWWPLFSSGELYPVIDSVYAFTEVQAAHERMEKNINVGKIILELPG